jgi:hypothetical protein
MHLIINTAREKVQTFRIYFPVGLHVQLRCDLLNDSIAYKNIGNILPPFIDQGCGMDYYGGHGFLRLNV